MDLIQTCTSDYFALFKEKTAVEELNKKVVLCASGSTIFAVLILATGRWIFNNRMDACMNASLITAVLAVTMLFGGRPWRQGIGFLFLAFLSSSVAGTAVLAASFDTTGQPWFLAGAFFWGLGTCLAALFANLDDQVPPRLLVIIYSLEMLVVFFCTKALL